MAADDPDKPERPDYKVYGGGRSRKSARTKAPSKRAPARKPASPDESDRPAYNVYRSREGPLDKLKGAASLSALRERLGRGGDSSDREPRRERVREPGEKPRWRTILRWTLIVAGAWFLLSVVLFAVSAQIQKGKLADPAGDELGGNPLLAATPQTILVIGTDARPEATGAEEAETRTKCIRQGSTGAAPSPGQCRRG
jgi:hypothetical protein